MLQSNLGEEGHGDVIQPGGARALLERVAEGDRAQNERGIPRLRRHLERGGQVSVAVFEEEGCL